MPPELPVVSGETLVRALQKLGFVRLRQKGSHVVLRRGATGCVVPLHNELKRGTLMSILRQAGVPPTELIDVL